MSPHSCDSLARITKDDYYLSKHSPKAYLVSENSQHTAEVYSSEDVLTPRYRLTRKVEAGVDCCDLFMQTFMRSADDSSVWTSPPEDAWLRVATIRPDRLLLFPVHVNPYAQRYLSPRHGRIRTLVYIDDAQTGLPDDADAALEQISRRLPWKLFTDSEHELGLTKELDDVWRLLGSLRPSPTLVITKIGEPRMNGDEIVVNESDLDALRRAMNRIDRRKRDGVRMAKRTVVFNELLTKLEPDRYIRADATSLAAPALSAPARHRRVSPLQRHAGRASVAAVRANLPMLASDSPAVLLELRAEIERVSLTEMIARYEELLAQELPESRWQAFFEANLFVLSLVFARPICLLQSQFQAQVSSLDGTGAQVGDFLFRELGQGLAIVEIKKPGTELTRGRPYRNTQVYAPSDELSGAITQTLFQQSHLRSNWLLHRGQPVLSQSMPDAIKCVVVAGRMPTDEAQRRSFEVFRNACKDVEVVTFDELLGKLRLLLKHLSPPSSQATSEVPF